MKTKACLIQGPLKSVTAWL